MFEVLQQADDYQLLSDEERRVAIGLAYDDDSRDEELEAMGLRVAARITSACAVAIDGIVQPTLRLERVRDTFRLKSGQAALYLSRRPVMSISGLTEDGVVLTEGADFEINVTTGKVTRLRSDTETCWSCAKVVVEYDAGYEIVPDALKAIAAQLLATYWDTRGIDPMEKSLNIPGVIATERWVDSGADGQLPTELMTALIDGGFVNRLMVG
jgi:hypothetical protein